MTATDEVETTQPLFYIRWRNEATRDPSTGLRGATGRYDGLYSEEDANIWIKSMNDNEGEKGRTYWKEPVTK